MDAQPCPGGWPAWGSRTGKAWRCGQVLTGRVVGRRDLSAVLSGSSTEDAHVCPVVVPIGITHCRWVVGAVGLWLTREKATSSSEMCPVF